ncbi:MAG: hypothetical protein ACJAZ8_002096 [Planctomycetota bacterium]
MNILRAALFVGLLCAASCGGAGVAPNWEPPSFGTQAIPAGHEVFLRQARAALERGDFRSVNPILASTRISAPDCAIAALLSQDAELAKKRAPRGLLFDPWQMVSMVAWLKAKQSKRGLDFLLAARMDEDGIASMNMLDQILTAEPRNPADIRAWAHYGLAFRLVQSGDLAAARRSLRAALKEQPGHLLARRLEVRLESPAQKLASKEIRLAYWLERAVEAPEVPSTLWYDSVVDLAVLRMGRNDGKSALKALAGLDYLRGAAEGESLGEPSKPWGPALPGTAIRAGLVRAAALASVGRPEEALAQSEATLATATEAGLSLPLGEMQRARLFERWFQEPEMAASAWAASLQMIAEEVQTGAASGQEFDELMHFIQAQIRLERLREEGFGLQPDSGTP